MDDSSDHLRDILDSSWLAAESGELPTPVDDEVVKQALNAEAHRSRTRWASDVAQPDNAHSFGVALSGGGSRAAAFSLGVLQYLVESGMNRFVTCISSVSGGSLANAVALGAGDFPRLDAQSWRLEQRRSARVLAKGVIPPLIVGSMVFALVLLLAGAGITVVALIGLPRVLVLLLLALCSIAIFGARGRILEACIRRRLLCADAEQRWRQGGGCLHVISATDLEAGRQVHFVGPPSSPLDGSLAEFGGMTLARSIRASAAFPGLVPPARLRTDGRTRHLVDGGVINNLATDWFERAARDRRAEKDPASIKPEAMNPEGLVVVDAGAPLGDRPIRRLPPMVNDAAVMLRSMSILYENTVAPRREALDDRLVIEEFAPQVVRDKVLRARYMGAAVLTSASHGAGDLAASLWWEQGARPSEPSIASRARVGQLFGRIHGTSGHDMNRLTPTTFLSLRSTPVAALMRHGFLAAMEAMYVAYDAPLIDPPTTDDLHDLLGIAPKLPRRIRRALEGREVADRRRFEAVVKSAIDYPGEPPQP